MMTNNFVTGNHPKAVQVPQLSATPWEEERVPEVRKFRATLQPGSTHYDVVHGLGTEDVVVSTRISGRVREGGVSIRDRNTVRLSFGGTLNEAMDVVIIG